MHLERLWTAREALTHPDFLRGKRWAQPYLPQWRGRAVAPLGDQGGLAIVPLRGSPRPWVPKWEELQARWRLRDQHDVIEEAATNATKEARRER